MICYPDVLNIDCNQKIGEFETKRPIFLNIICDEIIDPQQKYSALLEAMQKQITIGETTYVLESPFLVMATQTRTGGDISFKGYRFMLIYDYPN